MFCTVNEPYRDAREGVTASPREVAQPTDECGRSGSAREPIAIVGLSCALPGARDLGQFWANVLSKVDAIREVPPERWDWRPYYAAARDERDRVSSRWGGFLAPVLFDPADYGMPPNSVSDVEPLQLVMLEVARAALCDAGYTRVNLPHERTAIVLGAGGGFGERGHEYAMRAALTGRFAGCQAEEIVARLPEWNEDTFAGILMSMLAGRVASRLNLGGANLTVDAACAGSLAAVYMACHELHAGDADVVITGGADFCQNPFYYFCFDKTHALSPGGHCRAFDQGADGTALGEGVVAIVLKRLADAERDGNRIYAVIKGMASSSDGRGAGLTAPHVKGQVLALDRAYKRAGLSPATLGLIEAHGTGTVAGDRCEIRALKRVLEAAGASPSSVALGSVKSMIGHTKSTAGAAGILKAALALHHRVLPPTLGVEKPNPSLADSPLYLNTETRPWIGDKAGAPRRAAVSAFGFGGANYHAVLEEYPACAPAAALSSWPCELFLWRGATPAQTIEKASRVRDALKAGAQPSLRDLSFSLWRNAPPEGDATLAIVASSLDDLAAKIETARTGAARDPSGVYVAETPARPRGAVAFLFPGQGSQYPDMLRELAVHFAEVREAFEAADRTVADHYDRPLSRFVFPPPRFGEEEEHAARQALTATRVAQPALGAAEMGMLALLRALGVEPDMAAGHSYGEYAALCAAGCLAPESLYGLSEARGRAIVDCANGDLGTMAAAAGDEAAVRGIVGNLPDLWIANVNAPRQTIVSGTKTAVTEATRLLESRQIAVTPLPVACAFHSPLVAPAKERLKAHLAAVDFARPRVPVFSNTTAAPYPDDPEALRALLGEHLVSPVRFVSQIEAMYEAGARIFVEVGPRSVLTGLTAQILAGRGATILSLESRNRSGLVQLLHVLAQLAVQGVRINLARLCSGRNPRELPLDRLVAETAPSAPPITAWWVAGGRVTPVNAKPGVAMAPPVNPSQSATVPCQNGAMAPEPARELPCRPELSRVSPRPAGEAAPFSADSRLATLLHAHEQVMQQLLDTHRRVMAAAIGQRETQPSRAQPVALAAPVGLAGPTDPADPINLASPTGPADADHIRREVLRIVGERTGYPPDMLNLDADLEAELGIDSIKRVEIAGRLRKAFPQLGPTPDSSTAGNLASLRTLRGLIERIASVPVTGQPEAPKPPPPAVAPPASVAQAAASVHIPRFMMRLEDAPPLAPVAIPGDGVFLVTDDEGGLSDAVAEALDAQGRRVAIVSARDKPAGRIARYQVDFSDPRSLHLLVAALRKAEGRVAGLVHLLPLRGRASIREMTLDVWRQAVREDVKALFYLAQAAADDLKTPSAAGRARLLAAIEADNGFPGHGGIPGLINTLATEWPGLACRSLAVDKAEPIPTLCRTVLAELSDDSPVRFVRCRGGQRQAIRIDSAELAPGGGEPMRIASDWVILLTGGACGITAQVAREFAERFKPTLILTGRSAPPPAEEAPATRGVEAPEELRRLLAKSMSGPNGNAALAEVEAAYRQLRHEREIRGTLSAIRGAGARVSYVQADARDERAFAEAIARVYEEFGRLDGVVHGAGTIEDKRVEDKRPDSFDRVFDTKADGAFILARCLRPDSLKFAAFFSSVAYLGNAGQSDYAAANGVLNALAHDLDRRLPGRVVSVLWGPWQSAGMASEEVQRRFRERGVQIIPPEAGRRIVVDELLYGRKGDVEVLLGDAPYRGTASAPGVDPEAQPLVSDVREGARPRELAR